MPTNIRCKILVCCHKKDICAVQSPYFPLHVGKAVSTAQLGIQGDNDGDSISSKNPSYCELTGMYWAWKNLKNVEIIGLCHYRRYFDFHRQCRGPFPWKAFYTHSFPETDLSVPQNITEMLKPGTVIVPKSENFGTSLFVEYCTGQISDDFRTLETVINETADAKYQKAFTHILYCTHKFIPYNMFIMTWPDFDKYCSWLFPLLLETEKRIDITHYSVRQKRVFGFMAERLFNVYLYAEKKHLLQYPVIWFNDEMAAQKQSALKYRCITARDGLSFAIANIK